MNKRRRLLHEIVYVLIMLASIIVLFHWYTTQNSKRMEDRNINFAEDSAKMKAEHIDKEFDNALDLISAYSYFLGESLSEPTLTVDMLNKIEEKTLFDKLRFTDLDGNNYSSDGQMSDASDRDYYIDGKEGKSGISVIFNSRITDETMVGFFSPLRYKGEIIGVLRGAYLDEEYLQDMLATTYFGEQADVFLCMPDGRVIASSDDKKYDDNIIDTLFEAKVIDKDTAADAREIFENGGEGAFICDNNYKIDNICVMYLPKSDFVLVQLFPKCVTQKMIKAENLIGIKLESMMIGLFVIYIITLIVRAEREKKQLENENQEMGYIIDGVNTLFSRFAMVDFEADTYRYLTGTKPEDSGIAVYGKYKDLIEYISSLIIDKKEREEFVSCLDKDSIIGAMNDHSDLRFECHVLQGGQEEWEHLNIICLERKNGIASKVLFIRQNITEIKEKELQIQANMALADRKERQYRIAITSKALCTFEFNLTKDIIKNEIIREIDGRKISMISKMNLELPCKASDYFERLKQFVSDESTEEYDAVVNVDNLKTRFEHGDAEVVVEYWEHTLDEEKICVRQSFIMTRDNDTNDIMVMVVTKEITGSVKKQMEQTQALQDALMQAQHANKSKTTFLSNMSHDIRTPMNAIIGFTTIAVTHIDNKEQVLNSLQKVLSSSNHLLSLINDILDMSRIESGKVQIKEQECNIAEIMHNLVNIIQPQVKAKQLKLFIDTFDVENEEVIADSLKLNQVFINLLSNAVKYTPAGGNISFRIIQKKVPHHGYGDYIFIIEDNGIGMSPEFVEHIFEPFERESTVTQSGIQGTGLGMAITRNIVEMMNGTISVNSEVGRGSTITVELTLKLQDVEKDADQIKELDGLRALVVDDDFRACDSVCKMLKQIGMRSEWTTSGREAVYRTEIAYEDGDVFHTYIIDWQMPEMSGIETARRIRSVAGKDVPIIILTAYDWSDIEEEAREAGVTAFCAKPIFMSNLKSALLVANDLVDETENVAVWTLADFSGKRVLLVEDIELNREIAEVILTEAGFVVETAPDGTDAVDMVKKSEENYYDLVLMDVQMPIMNGYEATRTIRSMNRNDVKTLPIIAMTANALEEDKEAAFKNGMNAHISKPLDIDAFVNILNQILS